MGMAGSNAVQIFLSGELFFVRNTEMGGVVGECGTTRVSLVQRTTWSIV
jgi:hypothetical protein